MNGIVLIDKPKGWTSFDVVNYVRKLVAAHEGKKPKAVKVGHTGTLDPMATGLLVVLVGKEYTRRATTLTKADKTYEVTMTLGVISLTGDEEGEKTVVSDRHPSLTEVQAVLRQFTGQLMQVPPAFSAMKVNGKRAYELARAGKPVELEPRPAMIHSNELTGYEYPVVRFTARVGSGTYIRSLVTDMGKALETGAYMSDLRRTTAGNFDLKQAIPIQGATIEAIAGALSQADV
jgi:tRNA pseudouridine55 synthase